MPSDNIHLTCGTAHRGRVNQMVRSSFGGRRGPINNAIVTIFPKKTPPAPSYKEFCKWGEKWNIVANFSATGNAQEGTTMAMKEIGR